MNLLDEYRAKVEAEIRLLVEKGSTPLLGLDTMNAYHMGFCDREGKPLSSSKGKYLRPIFCIAMCAGLGGDPEQVIPAAAALELAHRTTLIFDDIQDKGIERNNQPTVWYIWGVEQAMNAGLILSCYARLAIHRLTLRDVPSDTVLGIQSVLENAVVDLCHGQFMDISFGESLTVSVDDYLKMIRGKTGALFAASCAVGAMVAMQEPEEVPAPPDIEEGKRFRYLRSDPVLSAAWEFGLNMGIAFQIHDDYLGVWGDEVTVGKTANDLAEKKRSLPIILALEKQPENIAGWLKHSPANENEVRILKKWMEENGISAKIRQMETDYIKAAEENLRTLSLSAYWFNQMYKFLDFVTKRNL